jgi:hypothetical protein
MLLLVTNLLFYSYSFPYFTHHRNYFKRGRKKESSKEREKESKKEEKRNK